MQKKVVYIASLPHSGSTLLNLMLGQHPAMIGLGGIDNALRWFVRAPQEAARETCSCGALVGECVYWKEVLAAARARTPQTVAERYVVALDVFGRVFGPDAWAVDAGQIHETPEALAGTPGLDLRVLFLARDFRSAVVSMVDLKLRRKKLRRPRFLLSLETALRWQRENTRIASALRRTNLPRLSVGYEEWCLRLETTFGRVCDFLGITPFTPTREVHAGTNHSFLGNDMRKQASKKIMAYDYRWMTRSDWWLPGWVIPGLVRRNNEWVYAGGEDATFRR